LLWVLTYICFLYLYFFGGTILIWIEVISIFFTFPTDVSYKFFFPVITSKMQWPMIWYQRVLVHIWYSLLRCWSIGFMPWIIYIVILKIMILINYFRTFFLTGTIFKIFNTLALIITLVIYCILFVIHFWTIY
jgi:hypothetical protein